MLRGSLKMYDIVCIGNLTQDVFIHIFGKPCFSAGTKQEVSEINFSFGGGALNTSVAMTNLGLKAVPLGSVGFHGQDIISFFKKRKIPTKYLSLKGDTAYSTILTGSFDRVVLMHGGAIKNFSEFPKKIPTKWIYISSLHGNFSLLRKIFSYASKNKIKIAWNPGILELSKNLSGFLKKTNILFLNEKEFKMLKGKPPEITIITNNDKGARMPFFNLSQKAIKVKVKDTTGAGDSFNSAFLAFYLLGYSFSDCLKAGAINSGYTLKEIGGYTSLEKKELIRLMKKY